MTTLWDILFDILLFCGDNLGASSRSDENPTLALVKQISDCGLITELSRDLVQSNSISSPFFLIHLNSNSLELVQNLTSLMVGLSESGIVLLHDDFLARRDIHHVHRLVVHIFSYGGRRVLRHQLSELFLRFLTTIFLILGDQLRTL